MCVRITCSGFLVIKGNGMPFPSFPFSYWMKYSGWNTDAVIGARTANSSQEVKTKYVEDGELTHTHTHTHTQKDYVVW